MSVITISRQLGSGGAKIARLVADRLGYRLVDRELVDAVAARVGVSAAVAGSVDEQTYDWAGGLIQSLLLAMQGQRITQESYNVLAHRLIHEAAARDDVVILGRGGQVVLGFRPATFHIHVVAPLEERVRRVATRDGVSPDEARRRIEASDEGRQRYIGTTSQRDWADPLLYDLILNTHRLTPEAAADLIVDGANKAARAK